MEVSPPDPFVDVRPKCTVCLEQVLLDGYALLNCSHVFHPLCIARYFRETTGASCPVCRIPVDSSVLVDLGIDPVTRTRDDPSTTNLHRTLLPTNVERPNDVFARSSIVSTPSSSSSSQISDPWSETFSNQLMSDSEQFASSSSESSETSRLEKPAFYRTSILNFLRSLNLTDAQRDQLISFKRRCGKYAVCDAVIRAKVFLALDRDFQFTSLDDMLHECKNERRLAKSLDKIYLKYTRDNPSVQTSGDNPSVQTSGRNRCSAVRGSVYNFFDLPEPRARNPSSTLLERSFQNIIQKGFGVTLPVMVRDIQLLNFYKRYPLNLHDVLRYAKLRCKEKLVKKQMMGLKHGILGCRRKRRNGWF